MKLTNRYRDLTFDVIITVGAYFGIAVLILILILLLGNSFPALSEFGLGEFITESNWNPTNESMPKVGAVAMLACSLLISIGAVAIAFPIGLFYLAFVFLYSPKWVAFLLRRIMELIGGIPSIVFGLWGLITLVPMVNQYYPPGASMLSATLVLALMTLPTIIISVDAALSSCRFDLMLASNALGISKESYFWCIAIPQAKYGMIVGIVLSLTRVIGETMAVVMVSGNVIQIPGSVFDPIRTVTANLALEMGYAADMHRSALFTIALVLILMIGTLVLTLRWFQPRSFTSE